MRHSGGNVADSRNTPNVVSRASLAALAAGVLAWAGPTFAVARADESKDSSAEKKDAAAEKKVDEFETTWIGVKLELWYPPTLDFRGGIVGGRTLTLPGDSGRSLRFSGSAALGADRKAANPTGFDFPGPIRVEGFLDTRWFSASVWGLTPFEYSGQTTLQTELEFGRVKFTPSTTIRSTLAQTLLGLDLELNILNNRWVRLSPILALRALAVNWTVHSIGPVSVEASTSDIDSIVRVGNYQVIPYPEVGAELRAGYRDFVELDAKLTGFWLEVNGLITKSIIFDVGVTGYLPPLPNLGMRIGYRYYYVNMDTGGGRDKRFAADLRFDGFNVALIARF